MSFESKRLRVQLPCEPGGTVQEIELKPLQSRFCCWFPTRPMCRYFHTCQWPITQYGCGHFLSQTCHHFQTPPVCGLPSCDFGSCEFGTPCGFGSPVGGCEPQTEIPVDPGTILVDPEHLPMLREQLEAQLKELEKAEEELKKHREANE